MLLNCLMRVRRSRRDVRNEQRAQHSIAQHTPSDEMTVVTNWQMVPTRFSPGEKKCTRYWMPSSGTRISVARTVFLHAPRTILVYIHWFSTSNSADVIHLFIYAFQRSVVKIQSAEKKPSLLIYEFLQCCIMIVKVRDETRVSKRRSISSSVL